jgi:hypothetical protein
VQRSTIGERPPHDEPVQVDFGILACVGDRRAEDTVEEHRGPARMAPQQVERLIHREPADEVHDRSDLPGRNAREAVAGLELDHQRASSVLRLL